ncbi:spexin prohormone 2-like [Cyprinodon tularosa]|uniref:spexin prohormone 2-like n=1 Tax=Cyprinodon tularosa TaxID=77115 RepID=UPI0018E25291|nr:spexin prohormone 2-like [Cyprinodon tularosa]
MKTIATVIMTWSLVISLIVESCHAQKLDIHWGPQSMMYLKGKYGKRFVLEDDTSALKQSLQGLSALLREIQMLQTLEIRKRPKIVSLEKIFIQNLQER